MIRHRLAIGGVVVGLLAGGVLGAELGVPGLVSAQDATTTTAASTTTVAPNSGAPDDAQTQARRDQRLKDTLAPLVKDGTITQAQADAVIKALEAAQPAKGAGGAGPGAGHMGPSGFGFGLLRTGLDTAATTIGVSRQALVTALAGGQSIADVAKAHGVDPQKVIDALVADAKTSTDKAVAAKTITQDQADQRLLQAGKLITDAVNGKLPAMPGGLGLGHFGHAASGQSGSATGGTTQGD